MLTNRSSVLIVKGDFRGDPALSKRICGFDSRLVLGHTKDIKNGSGPCLLGTRLK